MVIKIWEKKKIKNKSVEILSEISLYLSRVHIDFGILKINQRTFWIITKIKTATFKIWIMILITVLIVIIATFVAVKKVKNNHLNKNDKFHINIHYSSNIECYFSFFNTLIISAIRTTEYIIFTYFMHTLCIHIHSLIQFQ